MFSMGWEKFSTRCLLIVLTVFTYILRSFKIYVCRKRVRILKFGKKFLLFLTKYEALRFQHQTIFLCLVSWMGFACRVATNLLRLTTLLFDPPSFYWFHKCKAFSFVFVSDETSISFSLCSFRIRTFNSKFVGEWLLHKNVFLRIYWWTYWWRLVNSMWLQFLDFL